MKEAVIVSAVQMALACSKSDVERYGEKAKQSRQKSGFDTSKLKAIYEEI